VHDLAIAAAGAEVGSRPGGSNVIPIVTLSFAAAKALEAVSAARGE